MNFTDFVFKISTLLAITCLPTYLLLPTHVLTLTPLQHYKVIARVLVFLGPMLNPWLYPIRMASIRSFLVTKKKSIASSGKFNLVYMKIKISWGKLRIELISFLPLFSIARIEVC